MFDIGVQRVAVDEEVDSDREGAGEVVREGDRKVDGLKGETVESDGEGDIDVVEGEGEGDTEGDRDAVEILKAGTVEGDGEGDREDDVNQPMDVDDFPTPKVNVVRDIPTSLPSVICHEFPDPNVVYKNMDKQRGRRRSRFLLTPYTDPRPKKKKGESQDSIEFRAFLKSKDEVR